MTRILPILLLLLMVGCATRANGGAESPRVTEIHYQGETRLPVDSLRRVVRTRQTECELIDLIPTCVFGLGRDVNRLDRERLAADVQRLEQLYRRHGYYGNRIIPQVERVENGVEVTFRVRPGPRVTVEELAVEGGEGLLPDEPLPLAEGEPFRQDSYFATLDTLRVRLGRRGYAYAEVRGEPRVDTATAAARVRYEIDPGPVARLDTLVVNGAGHLDAAAVRGILSLREGERIAPTELERAQRRLVRLPAVADARVKLLPESPPPGVDTVEAQVRVEIFPAPEYRTEIFAGYGTRDCLQAEASRLDRSFLGSAHRLEITAGVSRIGVADPTAAGLERSLCPDLRDDPFRAALNYRFLAEIESPPLEMWPRWRGALFAHRISEPHAYLRTAQGAWSEVARPLGGVRASASLTLEHVRTEAAPVIACLAYEACTEAERAALDARWSAILGLAVERPEGRFEPAPLDGLYYRAVLEAAPGLGEDGFVRVQGDVSAYRELSAGWVLAGRLHGGALLDGGAYVPPERRFYLGGPGSVRGYRHNALGPTAYVATLDGDEVEVLGSPAGGTRMLAGSLELRRELTRKAALVAFLDAGKLWVEEPLLIEPPLRLTPGAGIRYQTELGPVRIDFGLLPYEPAPGPLWLATEEELQLLLPRYAPEGPPWWERVRIHFAIGQAF